jgi:hypothetical protein
MPTSRGQNGDLLAEAAIEMRSARAGKGDGVKVAGSSAALLPSPRLATRNSASGKMP